MYRLFDADVIRAGNRSGMDYGGDEYEYIARSGRPEMDCVRGLLEDWWSEYPEERRTGIASRMLHGDDKHSAFFELLLYHLLRRLGARVEVEPAAQGRRTSHPDFRVTLSSGHTFWLEAVGVSHGSERQDRARKHQYQIVNYLNKHLVSPDCRWHVRVEAIGNANPNLRRLRKAIETQMQELPLDAVADALAGGGDMAPYEVHWEEDGWKVAATPRRCGNPVLHGGKRSVGSWTMAGEYVNARERVREAVRRKLKQHRGVVEPLVVAVNVVGPYAEWDCIFEGLYGTEKWWVPIAADAATAPICYRDTDGVWGGPENPRYQRLTAVLAAAGIGPTSWPRRCLTVHPNPFAEVPSGFDLPDLALVTFDGTAFRLRQGRTLGEIMDFDHNWPE